MSNPISRHQSYYLAIWLILGTGILTLPFGISQFVIRDAWMSAALTITGPLLLAAEFLLFKKRFPSTNLVNAIYQVLGRWLGIPIVLYLLLWCFIISSTVCREMSIFLTINFLPQTPIYVVMGIFIFGVSFAVYHGIHTMGTVAELITPIAILITVVLFLFSTQNARIENMMPMFADGLTPIVRGAVLPCSFTLELFMFLIFITDLPSETIERDIVWSGLFITTIGIVNELIVTCVLGRTRIYFSYPVLEVIRAIRIGDFLDRMDTIYVVAIIATIFVKMAIFYYALCVALQHTLQLKSHKSTVWTAGAVIWAGSIFYFKDSITMEHFIINEFPAFTITVSILIPMLLCLLSFFRKSQTNRNTAIAQS